MREIEYFWILLGRCNYRCPYCVYGMGEFDDRRKDELRYGANQWLAAWERAHEKYGSGSIFITGGEPTVFPNFAGMVERLSAWFYVAFDTNLSWTEEALAEFLRRVSPNAVRFELSFHPDSTDPETYIKKARLIAESGFGYINRVVAYPPLLAQVPRYRELFQSSGLTFIVNPFQGTYDGRRYPEAYTDAERRLIERCAAHLDDGAADSPHKAYVKRMLRPDSPKGRLCRSGYLHIRIEDDGNVYRCEPYARRQWESLGNFFDERFSLWQAPRLCRSDFCEWEYRWLTDEMMDRHGSAGVSR